MVPVQLSIRHLVFQKICQQLSRYQVTIAFFSFYIPQVNIEMYRISHYLVVAQIEEKHQSHCCFLWLPFVYVCPSAANSLDSLSLIYSIALDPCGACAVVGDICFVLFR